MKDSKKVIYAPKKGAIKFNERDSLMPYPPKKQNTNKKKSKK